MKNSLNKKFLFKPKTRIWSTYEGTRGEYTTWRVNAEKLLGWAECMESYRARMFGNWKPFDRASDCALSCKSGSMLAKFASGPRCVCSTKNGKFFTEAEIQKLVKDGMIKNNKIDWRGYRNRRVLSPPRVWEGYKEGRENKTKREA